jgi:hypothetical protein
MKRAKAERAKTISDVTLKEWESLTVAAIDLLSMARFIFWQQVLWRKRKTSLTVRACSEKKRRRQRRASR